MSQEELNRHYAEGLCLNCHKPGHKARECPNRMTVPGGTHSQPPGINRQSGNRNLPRSTSSAAATLSTAAAGYSYADLNERERLASTTESQTNLSLNHIYLDFLNHIDYDRTIRIPIQTDLGSDYDLDSDNSSKEYETANEGGWESEEVESDDQGVCFYHQKKRVNCWICPIFDETRINMEIRDPVPQHIMECLSLEVPFTGDSEDYDEEDRFHVY